MTDRVIYVLGAPCSGTSCVAGVLHHLGVDMGEGHFMRSTRPYEVFEDSRAVNYRAEPTEAQKFIMGEGRDFRAYLEMRLEEAKEAGRIPGCKLGAAYWLGDPDPASLPVTIVKVDRPLEDSIASDWRYQNVERAKGYRVGDRIMAGVEWSEINDNASILRAAQMAGYWQAKERLCEMIEPAVVVDFYDLLEEPIHPGFEVMRIGLKLGIIGHDEDPSGFAAACRFVNPELRNV